MSDGTEEGGFLRWLHRVFVPSRHNAYHPHVFARRGVLTLFCIMVAAEGFLVATLLAGQGGVTTLAAVEPAAIIALTNTERQDDDLASLSDNSVLDAAAQAKANDMAAKGYFSHVGPDGKQPWDWISQFGYDYEYAGENLAVRFDESSDVVNAWMASPAHRANILKSQYQEIGVGVATGTYQGASATFTVQFFGTSAVPKKTSGGIAVAVASTSASKAGAHREEPPAAVGKVEGVSTVALPHTTPSSVDNSLSRQLARLFDGSRTESSWFFLGLALIVVMGLFLTFAVQVYKHAHANSLLLHAVAVCVFALGIVAFNSTLFSTSITATNESAGVALAMPSLQGISSDSRAILAATSTSR